MQRRSGSGQPVKGQSANRPKARNAPTAPVSPADLQEQVAALTRELKEARDHQMATGEILASLTGSIADARPVFEAIVRNLQRLFDTRLAVVQVLKDGMVHLAAAGHEEYETLAKEFPRALDDKTGGSRAMMSKQVVQFAPVLGNSAAPPTTQQFARDLGFNSAIFAPMMRGDQIIGSISTARRGSRPFDEREVALIKAFADQAVIAIENVRLFEAEQQRTHELSEALEQQTATSEVLKVISSSPGELKPVFDALLANAVRICDAKFGTLFLTEGDAFRYVALHGAPPAFAEARRREPVTRVKPGTTLGRVAATKKPAQTADIRAEPAYTSDPERIPIMELAGARTILAVPMLKESQLVGAIVIYRQEVRTFTDKQIDLLSNFAAQAVVAIENTRLLNELRQRTNDLSESLEQQTATSEVLKVISSSPGDLQPVFDAILANATDLCGARFASLRLSEGDQFRTVSLYNAPAALVEHWRSTPLVRPHPESALGRTALTKQVVQIDDVKKGAAYNKRDPLVVAGADLGGYRTVLTVPMLKEDVLIGVISIYRQEVKAFTDKQIELVKNFASQAVIAIENTRLLNELRESLQQQTATADVLKTISRSTFDLQVVLDALTASAAQLCEADMAAITRQEGTANYWATSYGLPPEHADYFKNLPNEPGRGSVVGRVLAEGKTVHVVDVLADPEYTRLEAQKRAGFRSILGVPLLREGKPIGIIVLMRRTVQPFTDKQIELVTTFADQAVIAIENARLFDEVQARTAELTEALQQQTATADVLKVISRSTFDLQTVLQTLVESAARLCDADRTIITRQKDGVFYRAEAHGFSREFMDYVRNIPIAAERGSAFGRALLEGRPVHIPDVKADPEYTLVEGQRLGDYRTVLAVPMLREGVTTGVLSLTRSDARPFSEKQIELASTFADQAAIAIENVRLFESVEARTRELAASLENLRTTQDRLVQTQKLASLGQLTAGIAHEIKNPLNFVNNFSGCLGRTD